MTAPTRTLQGEGEGRGTTPPSHRRARGSWRRVALSILTLGACAACLAGATLAGFSDTAINSSNQFQSGTVDIDDDDAGVAILSLTNAGPGGNDQGCITVTSRGTLASDVRLYGTTTGTGLDQFVTLTITRGTFSPTAPGFDSCTNFQPDAVQYIGGQANGVMFTGTLASFPDDYAGGVVDPTSGSPENWSENESHVYKIRIEVADDDGAEGLQSTQAFTWEARNT